MINNSNKTIYGLIEWVEPIIFPRDVWQSIFSTSVALGSGVLSDQSWLNLENVSMGFGSLAICCTVHVYVVNSRILRLMGAPGQDEVVLNTYSEWLGESWLLWFQECSFDSCSYRWCQPATVRLWKSIHVGDSNFFYWVPWL